MEAIDEKVIGKYKIEIFPDDSPFDPRGDDNLGTMICFHSRYSLGDKHNFSDPDEARKFLKGKEVAMYLNLYLYDHSGITMSTSPFSCPWDSGQVGWIYITKEKIREEYNCQRISAKLYERVKGYLKNEVATYDQYLTGDVYGYRITEIDPNDPDEEGEEVDSCWGYYGDDECMEEAEGIVNYMIERDAKEIGMTSE